MVMTKSNSDCKYFSTTIILLSVIACVILFTKSTSTIDQLKHQIDTKDLIIDSLKHEIDTLQWEYEIYDYNYINNTTHLISAIMFVESSYNNLAYNASEDAVGCLQIRKCMVDDINRILKRQNLPVRYSYNDRWSRNKSIQMFDIYCKYYKLNTAEEIARCWNGGPNGMQNEMTVGYWEKVSNKLDI
tara:strand:+ start:2238 stop:2798 length:561 start_codon:yes stop_codon:yes gene_type:complete